MKNGTTHFILIPSDNRGIKRWSVTDRRFKLAAFGLVLGFVFSLFATAGFFYYRASYRRLVAQLSKDRVFEQQKQELIAKLHNLEGDIDRTERFAAKLEMLVGLPQSDLEKGIGPVSPVSSVGAERGGEEPFAEHKLSLLKEKSATLEKRINEAYERFQDRVIFLASTPSLWPVKGWLTSEFGMRSHPLHSGSEMHEGVDIAAQWGTPIVAPADGVISFAGYKGGLGKTITIHHGFGISTTYGHTSKILVSEGQKVKRGMRIAAVGSSGSSTGPHLHYEIHVDGVPVDPVPYVLR